jgi:hypothetical protein
MPNEFAEAPQLEPGFPIVAKTWTCPITGLVVPKEPAKNLEYRAKILALAENDPTMQADLYTACSKSLLYFVNAFCFTKRVYEIDDEAAVQPEHVHLPFVTWEIQDLHLAKLEECIDTGKSLLTDKSRDMGATWSHLIILTHRFLFRADESHLMLSRKEETVDQPDGIFRNYPYGALSDAGTLFGKIDYVLNRLPDWMLPKMSRKRMHLVNQDNKTRIDGESANATAGSSNRCTSIFMDEMAKMEHAESIKRSTRAVTSCRLPCSTPNGPGTAYSKWRLSGQIPVFILPWWEHPEKGKNRYFTEDDLGRFKIQSPWYDRECEECTAKEIAIEVDMDHVGSGNTIFDALTVELHKKLYGRVAKRKVRIDFKKGTSDGDAVEAIRKRDRSAVAFTPNGSWRLWCNLNNGRPDQGKTYTFAIDISKGQGASNSVISVMCDQTKIKVAEFADANVKPYELARIACAAAIWFGGTRMPFIIWENNGDPGDVFGHQLVTIYRYSAIYFDRQKGTIAQKKGKRYGWHSDREKKAAALGMLQRAYAFGGFINHSKEALDECLTYIRYDNGGTGPAELLEENANARATHGDRVIADMLCLVGTESRSLIRPNTEVHRSTHSIGGRLQQHTKRRKNERAKGRFDFRQKTG